MSGTSAGGAAARSRALAQQEDPNLDAAAGAACDERAQAPAVREIAFIDRGVSDLGTLLAGMRPDVRAFVLPGEQPALAEIAIALRQQPAVETVHIVAHGSPGAVNFRAGTLSAEDLADQTADLHAIRQALAGGN